MSYSTRRSGGYNNQQQQVGNVGQRRPVVTNNFVSGGQLKPPAKPVAANQQNAAQQPNRAQTAQGQHQQTSAINFKNQAQTPQQQAAAPPQVKQPPQVKPQQQPQQVQQQPQQVQQQPQQVQQQQQQQLQQQQAAQLQQQQQAAQLQQQQQAAQLQQQQQAEQLQQQQAAQLQQQVEQQLAQLADSEDVSMQPEVKVKKPFWARGAGGKVSRRERVRRRNVRLSRMLQPKNAVMILNELVKNTSYMVEELPAKFDGNQFKATVLYEGVEHVGYGRSKIHAKNTAAEAALKHIIKPNKLAEVKKDEDGNEKMDVSEDESNQSPLPWQHVASFALYKLFCSWGEDPSNVKSQTQNLVTGEKHHENRPAKKMPENPDNINPLMLINQMLPQASFEEVGKTGNPPNVTFSFRCNVDGEAFVGTGPNKKAAKKMAAFGACSKILGITYPPEIYVPTY